MKTFIEPRARQQMPREIVGDLLGVIRGQFCGDLPDKKWFQQQRFFLRVVTWPAGWLKSRGVTLTPERYKAVLVGIFGDIKTHGTTGAVKHWPGYLLHCVQEHFKHHGDELYEEAKAVRHLVERSLAQARPGAAAPDPIETLAGVKAVLSPGRGRRAAKPRRNQLSLL